MTASILILICTLVVLVLNLWTWLNIRKIEKLLSEARQETRVTNTLICDPDNQFSKRITESLRNVGRWPG